MERLSWDCCRVQVDGDCCCQRPRSKEPSKYLINVRHAAALQSACRRHAAYVMLTTCLLLPFGFDRPSRYAGAGQHVELPQEAKDQVQCAADPLQTSSFSPAGPVGLDQDHHQLILYAITDTTIPNSSSTSQNIRLSFATHCQPASHTHSTEAQHATAYRRQTTHSSTPDSTLQHVCPALSVLSKDS